MLSSAARMTVLQNCSHCSSKKSAYDTEKGNKCFVCVRFLTSIINRLTPVSDLYFTSGSNRLLHQRENYFDMYVCVRLRASARTCMRACPCVHVCILSYSTGLVLNRHYGF